jgi:ATP/maltotriose-dependent transcriptional regulator MalT
MLEDGGEPHLIAQIQQIRAEIALASGDARAALRWVERAEPVLRERWHVEMLGRLLTIKSRALAALGDSAAAALALEEAAPIARVLGEGSPLARRILAARQCVPPPLFHQHRG